MTKKPSFPIVILITLLTFITKITKITFITVIKKRRSDSLSLGYMSVFFPHLLFSLVTLRK